ncbi:MAG: UTP--glucose-1-phosphate uridylyltransferase [Candidatus Brocadiia bacterium]
MTADRPDDELMDRLSEHGQEHVRDWFDDLTEEEATRLRKQLETLDFGRLERFRTLLETPPTSISFDDVEPAPVRRLPLTERQEKFENRVTELGRQTLESDRVAALTVAGGQGTRLGYDHPKGMYPISPIENKSLFRLFAEQILAARNRYGCGMPWLIMTGHTNDEETREYFREEDFFGLGEETVHFFVQKTNPILDADGRLLRAERDDLLVGPDGHGGVFDALADAGLLEVLREGGRDLISYFQVDNPLVTVADPRFLGHHVNMSADFSCKVVAKRDPEEGLGLAVLKAGQPAVIEYIDVPEEVASERLPNGKLRYRFGSIAIHIMDVPFAERVAGLDNPLPWHIAEKTYEVVDESGEKTESPPDGCRKFEQFVFEALPYAQECAFVEVRRDTEFAPVKNAEGEDSPETARHLMQRMWVHWLQKAGADVEMPKDFSEPLIEISPLYASDAEELAEKWESGRQPSFPLVLEP